MKRIDWELNGEIKDEITKATVKYNAYEIKIVRMVLYKLILLGTFYLLPIAPI